MPAAGPQTQLKDHSKALLNSFSEVYFINSPLVGAIFWALTLVNPRLSIAGVVTLASAYGFAQLIGLKEEFLRSGYYTYNPLLVGLGLGAVYGFSWLSLLLAVLSGIMTLVVTLSLARIFYLYLGLPILSLPFVVVISIVTLAGGHYSNLLVVGLYPQPHLPELPLPLWVLGYLRSLATIFFMPYSLVGLAMALVLGLTSPLLLGLSVAGYYTGSLIVAGMTGSFEQAFLNLNHFNYILIAMGVGGVFLVPSKRSFLLGLLAVAVSVLMVDAVQVFWATFGLPVLTLPFNLISLGFIYVLGLLGHPSVARRVMGTPEETLDFHLAVTSRFDDCPRAMALPFNGAWIAWQGFEGPWTHQGPWAKAYDFLLEAPDGKTYQGEGTRPQDYFAWGKPVLAPIAGRVVRTVRNRPDQPIGQVDRDQPWGNLVVLQTEAGWHLLLGHLRQDSLNVQEGDWVEPGARLGLCGNSGHSAQPHIHVQTQAGDRVGEATLDFRFSGFLADGQFITRGLPEVGQEVQPAEAAPTGAFSFPLDSVLTFNASYKGRPKGSVRWKVGMDAEGTYFFDSGRARLYFGRLDQCHCHFSLQGQDPGLRALFLALPRMPITATDPLRFHESLPVGLLSPGWLKRPQLAWTSLNHQWSRPWGQYTLSQNVLTGQIKRPGRPMFETRAQVDLSRGLIEFEALDWKYQRIEP